MKRRLLEHNVQFRAAGESEPARAEGYAAVFYRDDDPGTEFVYGRVHERIAPGAFDRAIRDRQDVVAKFNHDSNRVLGRVSAGTLRLSADEVGLRYSIDLPDTTTGKDLAVSLERKDVRGSSFAFAVRDSETEYRDGKAFQTLTDLDLGDVGPVVNPAYTATQAELRDADLDALDRMAAKYEEALSRDARIRRWRAVSIDMTS